MFGATSRFPTGAARALVHLGLICSELPLDHLRVPTGYPSAPYWWLLRAVDLLGSTPSQRHFSRVSNNRQLALLRPLKAVARVRIPSGLPGKPPLTRHGTTSSQPASPRIDRQGRARTPARLPSAQLQISRIRLPNMGSSAGGVVLSRGWTSSGTARLIGTLQRRASTIKRHYRPGDTRHVGDRQARAIGLKDAGRRQKLAIGGGFPDQSPLSQNWRRE